MSTLDDLRDIEDKAQKVSLVKILQMLKKAAKETQEAKEKCNVFLELATSDKAERKKIIDWINSLSDVALTDAEMDSIAEKCEAEVREAKASAQKQVATYPVQPTVTTASYGLGLSTSCTAAYDKFAQLNANYYGTSTTALKCSVDAPLILGNCTVSNTAGSIAMLASH
jgi:dihydroxyacid dehydratase/phosphogluconate dehydratase